MLVRSDESRAAELPARESAIVSGPRAATAGARATVKPCSSPSGPFAYHACRPGWEYVTRLSLERGAAAPRGASAVPYPIPVRRMLTLVRPDRTDTPEAVKLLDRRCGADQDVRPEPCGRTR